MAAVQASRPDVPSDTANPAFPFGFGLRYDQWTPAPLPTEAEKNTTSMIRPSGGRYRLHRTTIGLLLKDPQAKRILTAALPQLFSHPMVNVSHGMDIYSAITMVAPEMTPDVRAELISRLTAL
ncbi:hypothetical protein ACVBEQ_26830 [Nakamurella sp. GG22]